MKSSDYLVWDNMLVYPAGRVNLSASARACGAGVVVYMISPEDVLRGHLVDVSFGTTRGPIGPEPPHIKRP